MVPSQGAIFHAYRADLSFFPDKSVGQHYEHGNDPDPADPVEEHIRESKRAAQEQNDQHGRENRQARIPALAHFSTSVFRTAGKPAGRKVFITRGNEKSSPARYKLTVSAG